MQLSKHFWMVLVAALVASTPLQAAIVLHDDFNDDSLDPSKWSTFLGGTATIVEEDGFVKLRRDPTSSRGRPYLATVGQWTPGDGAEITVSGTVLSNGNSYFDVWTRAANYADSYDDGGWAASGMRVNLWPNAYGSYTNLGGCEKPFPGVAWTAFGTGVNLPTPKPPSPASWDFLLTDDGTNVEFTVTQTDVPENTATFTGTSSLSGDTFYILFNGENVDIDEITIVVGEVVRIPGDANNNGIVDAEDASILAAHWQMAGNWGDGDFNNDQIVDDQDAAILAAHWLMTGEEYASVPEPAMLVLLAGGLVTLLLWRRK